VVLHCAELDLAIGGDVLFRGSIGRTDLPGGDPRAMSDSIRRLYRELPADTRFLTGHGPDTTLATERTSNPYVRLIMGTAAGA
jgi:glyoxylase-like metal-dependent hydrolase (beta-lactamase superfamily II)